MLNNLKKFFEEKLLPSESETDSTVHGIEYATAALFIELAKSDFAQDDVEQQLIFKTLKTTFHLNEDELNELVSLAESASTDASDLYQFTSLVNQHYRTEQKIALLENFWRVAYADGRLDKYEEHFIRKVCGLINLAPSEFIKTKLRVKQQTKG